MKRRSLVVGATTTLLALSFPKSALATSTPNIPHAIGSSDLREYRDARGRPPIDPSVLKQPGSFILAVSGQSLVSNWAQCTPVNPPPGTVYELDTFTGNIYEVTDGSFPTMGMDHDIPGRISVLVYWATMLVLTGKAKRVLIAGHAIGGTTSREWCPDPGNGYYFPRSVGTVQWLNGLGTPPTIWVHMQGQADVDINNPGRCASYVDYGGRINWQFKALRNSGLSASCPIIIGWGALWPNISDQPAYAAQYNEVKAGQWYACQGAATHAGWIDGLTLSPDDDEWPKSYRANGSEPHQADMMRAAQWVRWQSLFPTV